MILRDKIPRGHLEPREKIPDKSGLWVEKVIQEDTDHNDEQEDDDNKLPRLAMRVAEIAIDDGLPVGGPLRVGLCKLLLVYLYLPRANPPGG